MKRNADSSQQWFLPISAAVTLGALAMGGCVHYEPRPLSPDVVLDRFEARRLDAPELGQFLRSNAGATEWPPAAWDLDALTLAALFYNPELDVARARWGVAEAGEVTAGARPNPSASAMMGYNASAAAGVTPWIPELVLDLPIETAGKRGLRVLEARHLTEAARLDVLSRAWDVRARVRRACLALHVARRTESLLTAQIDLQAESVDLLSRQHELGEVSANEVALARIALEHARLSALEAGRRSREGLVDLADAIGLTVSALEGVEFAFDALDAIDPDLLPAPEIRRRALVGRADILGALSRYEASQAALRLEIAKQYPDIDIGAGYQLDQTDGKWTLSLSLPIPILNRNKGPIAEARARRREAASEFLALQARVTAQVDRAMAACRAATGIVAAAETMLEDLQHVEETSARAYGLGEISKLDLVGAQLEAAAGRVARLEALSRAQEALGSLEEAMQSPLPSETWVLVGHDDG